MGAPRNTETSMVPPEFAGFSTVVSTLLPVVISCVGILPVVVLRLDPTASTGARASIAVAIATILTVMWVRSRDTWTAKIRNFFAEGQRSIMNRPVSSNPRRSNRPGKTKAPVARDDAGRRDAERHRRTQASRSARPKRGTAKPPDRPGRGDHDRVCASATATPRRWHRSTCASRRANVSR